MESGGKRGFLRTLVVPTGPVNWTGAYPATLYRNRYVLLEEIPASEIHLRNLVEKSDPTTQAVVVIEYAAGEKPVTELVNLRQPPGVPSRETVQ